MKKSFCLSLFLVLLVSSVPFSALALEQRLEVNRNTGEVKSTEVDSTWRLLTASEQAAYKHPGLYQPVGKASLEIKWLNPLHFQLVESYQQAVVFQDNILQSKNQHFDKSSQKTAWNIVFLLFAIGFFMIAANIGGRDSKIRGFMFFIAVIFASTSGCSVIHVFFFAYGVIGSGLLSEILLILPIFTPIIAASCTMGIASCNDMDQKSYKIFSTVFYVSGIFGIISSYLL